MLLAAHQADALPGSLPVVSVRQGPLRAQVLATTPNPAHFAVVDLQRFIEEKEGSLVVVTQNIDGLHERAGTANVIELHGSAMYGSCSDPHRPDCHFATVPVAGEAYLSVGAAARSALTWCSLVRLCRLRCSQTSRCGRQGPGRGGDVRPRPTGVASWAFGQPRGLLRPGERRALEKT